MNKKLALKISKHPLIKKLMEDRTISKNVIANLIVEEMDIEEAATKKTASAKKNLNTTLQKINRSELPVEDKIKAIQGFINNLKSQPGYYYTRYSQLEDEQKEIYNTYVSKKAIPNAEGILKILTNIKKAEPTTSPEQIQQAEQKLENQIEASLEKKAEKEEAVVNKIEQASQTSPEDFVNNIASVIVDMNKEQEFVSTYNQDEPAAIDFILNNIPEEQVDVLKPASTETQQKVVKAVADKLEPETTEPSEPQTEPEANEPKTDEDPKKFDVDSEALQTLISVSEEFIEQFYEKALLRDQGKLVRNVLDQLVKITEKEELEKAAQRRPQPQPEEEKPVQEQQQNPSALRNIQVDLKSFIKLAKRSKEVLQRFDEASEKGKVIGSSLKKKFMEMLAQLQENIRDLVQDISKLNLVQEAKDTSEIEKKWDAIEKGYNDASRALTGIIGFGSDKKEAFDMENNVKDAYNALMSISHFFPSVNPFGKKTSQDMKKYSEQYGAAIKDVKSVLRDVLELSQGQGGRSTASNAIKALKEFSGQIQSIFDVKSKFDDVVVQPNERAAQGEREDTPDTTDSSVEDIDDTKQQIDAKKAIEQFLQILVKENIVIPKKTEKQLSEVLNTIALAALSGATIAGIFKEMGSRYSNFDVTVSNVFSELLLKFLEKNDFINKELTGELSPGDAYKREWKEFPKDKKEVIVKAYRKKFKEKPELTGKKVQTIVADYLTDDFKLADSEEEPESEDEKEFEDEQDEEPQSSKDIEKEESPPYPEDTRYLSIEEKKIIEGEYLKEATESFFEQIQKATRKYYSKIGREHLPNDGMPLVSDLAALKMVNQKQKTASQEENNKALENMESAKNVIDAEDPFDIQNMKNFEQFLGDPNEYEDYKGSKNIIPSYLGIKLNRYNEIIKLLDEKTLKSIKEYINEEPKKKKETEEDEKPASSKPPEFHDRGPLEERISNKLKPLIREMLNKGK